LDLGSSSLRVCLNPSLDFVASSQHEPLLEECKRRAWRGLITPFRFPRIPPGTVVLNQGALNPLGRAI